MPFSRGALNCAMTSPGRRSSRWKAASIIAPWQSPSRSAISTATDSPTSRRWKIPATSVCISTPAHRRSRNSKRANSPRSSSPAFPIRIRRYRGFRIRVKTKITAMRARPIASTSSSSFQTRATLSAPSSARRRISSARCFPPRRIKPANGEIFSLPRRSIGTPTARTTSFSARVPTPQTASTSSSTKAPRARRNLTKL